MTLSESIRRFGLVKNLAKREAAWLAILAITLGGCDQEPIKVVEKRLPRIAPDGEAYLLKSHSASSDTEIRGFTAGTRVKIIEQRSEMTLVAVDDFQFEVPNGDLTDRIDEGGAMQDSQEQARASAAKEISQEQASAAPAEARKLELMEFQKQEDLRRQRIDTLRNYIAAAKDEMESLKVALRNSMEAGNSRNSIENEQRLGQINALNSNISAWNVELQTELKAAAEEGKR